MKVKLGYGLLFLFVVMISVIAHLPASWVVERFSPSENVNFEGVSGTVWNGSAQEVAIKTSPNMPTISLGQVIWSFNPLNIFLARLDYDVIFGKNSQIELMGVGHAGMGFSGVYLRDTKLSIPAKQVATFIEFPVPVEVEGQGKLSIDRWVMSSNFCVEGNGSLIWSDAKVDSVAGLLDVNLANADISCRTIEEEKRIEIVVTQQSDDFSSNINLGLDQEFNYNLNSSLIPEDTFPELFKQGLDMFAKKDNQGQYIYQVSGQLE